MKPALIFILCFCIGLGASLYLLNRPTPKELISPKQTTEQQRSEFSLENAPSESLHGDITLLRGLVRWQSRVATESSVITEKKAIHQGENIETGSTGQVSVAFPAMLFTLSPETVLHVIQTLPTNIVLEQPEGEIAYENNSSTPLAVRSLHLLTQAKNSNFSVITDLAESTVTIDVAKGSVDVAYNDSDNISIVQTVKASEELVFDDSARDGVIKKAK